MKFSSEEMESMIAKCLRKTKINEFPVDLFKIAKHYKITMVPYSDEKGKEMAEIIGAAYLMPWTDGFIIHVEEMYIIFWDDLLPLERQRTTIAHELGHFFLGHVGWNKNEELKEDQASLFAFHLLSGDSLLTISASFMPHIHCIPAMRFFPLYSNSAC